MRLQWSRNGAYSALAIAALSTTLGFSCSQIQAQNSTSESSTTIQTSATQSQISRSDTFVTSDPGIQIAVRYLQQGNATTPNRVPVLLIHGGGPGSFTSFDLGVPGYSVAEDLAAQGHSVLHSPFPKLCNSLHLIILVMTLTWKGDYRPIADRLVLQTVVCDLWHQDGDRDRRHLEPISVSRCT